jgi:hypothetical protein
MDRRCRSRGLTSLVLARDLERAIALKKMNVPTNSVRSFALIEVRSASSQE